MPAKKKATKKKPAKSTPTVVNVKPVETLIAVNKNTGAVRKVPSKKNTTKKPAKKGATKKKSTKPFRKKPGQQKLGSYGPKTKRVYKQTGKSNEKRDKKRKAKAPGWRRTAHGTVYYETRKNRSDMPGKRV